MELALRELPADVTFHRRTARFSAATVPAGLRADHSTKPGTWGLLVVEAGVVTFHDDESGAAREVTAGEEQVILPESLHHLRPSEDAEFFVAFYRAPETAA